MPFCPNCNIRFSRRDARRRIRNIGGYLRDHIVKCVLCRYRTTPHNGDIRAKGTNTRLINVHYNPHGGSREQVNMRHEACMKGTANGTAPVSLHTTCPSSQCHSCTARVGLRKEDFRCHRLWHDTRMAKLEQQRWTKARFIDPYATTV
jgi:hypothetical protein